MVAVILSVLPVVLVSKYQVTNQVHPILILTLTLTYQIDMGTRCYIGQIAIGDNGLVYGYYNSVLYTADTNTQQVTKGVTLPQSSYCSMAYLG